MWDCYYFLLKDNLKLLLCPTLVLAALTANKKRIAIFREHVFPFTFCVSSACKRDYTRTFTTILCNSKLKTAVVTFVKFAKSIIHCTACVYTKARILFPLIKQN